MNEVNLRGVSKRFGRAAALTGVDLTLGTGITGFLGPNGAGKTTLLRLVATALAPSDGELVVLGHDPATRAGRQEIRRTLGYLPQEVGFPHGFTTFGFVDYIAILKEWNDRSARHAEVRRVLDLLGLGDVAAKRIHALSGGQRRRAAIAQAMLGNPKLLVLDEPTVGLDPEQRAGLRDVLSQLGRTATVILSTHQTDDVAALCEQVFVLDKGRVHFSGLVSELVGSARGRVWQADERDPAARHGWRTGSGRWRHVGEPPVGADPVEPTLEDAYLLLIGDRARNSATVPA